MHPLPRGERRSAGVTFPAQEKSPKVRPTPTVLGIPLQRRFQPLLRDRRSHTDTSITRNAAAVGTRSALLLPFLRRLPHTSAGSPVRQFAAKRQEQHIPKMGSPRKRKRSGFRGERRHDGAERMRPSQRRGAKRNEVRADEFPQRAIGARGISPVPAPPPSAFFAPFCAHKKGLARGRNFSLQRFTAKRDCQ